MEGTASDPFVETCFPFGNLKLGATLVDVGGGMGHHSRRLMGKFPQMRFIVQDHEVTPDNQLAQGEFRWQKHDFLTPQRFRGADVYLLNNVLMDHPDRSVVLPHESKRRLTSSIRRHYLIPVCSTAKIVLAHIAEAMIPVTSTCLVNDRIKPELEVDVAPESSAFELHMLSVLNQPLRTESDWVHLVEEAHPGLVVDKIYTRAGGNILLVIRLQETQTN
jgi:hypothetical protein